MTSLDITINCHSSICINGNIYIDPFKIESENKAKYIFVTHSHYDHLDLESIAKLFSADCLIIAPKDCIEKLTEEEYPIDNLVEIAPNQKGEVEGLIFETFPSYNLGKKFHQKDFGWVGYTLHINGIRYTICGDSDNTPELQNISTDVLFVPIGGTYTMTALEAAALTNKIRPSIAIPVHFGTVVGSFDDAEDFCENVDKDIRIYKLIK